MAVFLIILSCLLWALSMWLLWRREMLAPIASLLALWVLSLAKSGGYQMLPINSVILIGWACMTLVVCAATVLQPQALMAQTRGMAYITGGALTGMVLGLLGFSFSSNLGLLYGIMVIATIAGVFLGFLLFTNTPKGRDIAPASGRFFKYLLAKGFPAAITVMMIGVVLVLLVARHNNILV